MEENDEDSSEQLVDDEEQGEEYENLVQRMTAEERLRELAEVNKSWFQWRVSIGDDSNNYNHINFSVL